MEKLLKNRVAVLMFMAASIFGQEAFAGPIYNGGPVMLGTPNINLIWYGDWSSYGATQNLVNDFVGNLGGSSWFNINTTYYQMTGPTKQYVSGSLNFAGSIDNSTGYTSGAIISDQGIYNIVNGAYSTLDTNSIYLVLTDPSLRQTYDNVACGWHSNSSSEFGLSNDIKFGWIGSVYATSYGCSAQTVSSPNNDVMGDALVSVIAHEIAEAVTDPNIVNGWWDSTGTSYTNPTYGYENADMGAWKFGTTYTTANGSKANIQVGGKNYLVQENWVIDPSNPNGGYLATGYAVPEPGTLALVGIGLLGAVTSTRRRNAPRLINALT